MDALPPAMFNFIIGILVLIIAVVLGQISWIGIEGSEHEEKETTERTPQSKVRFDLRTEVNNREFSLAQRKFLLVLVEKFDELPVFNRAINNLECDKIRAVLELFGKHIESKMVC